MLIKVCLLCHVSDCNPLTLDHMVTSFFCEWQEMFQLTLEDALSSVTTWRMSGSLFTSYSKSQRLSQMWQLGEMKLVSFKQHTNLYLLTV